jgi:hypothetical protein
VITLLSSSLWQGNTNKEIERHIERSGWWGNGEKALQKSKKNEKERGWKKEHSGHRRITNAT